jgi:hypothetical protein
MTHIIYYITKVPNVFSTTRYNHALGIAEQYKNTTLITHSPPPEKIESNYSYVEVIDRRSTPQRLIKATQIIKDNYSTNPDLHLVTTGQFEPVLVGQYVEVEWTVDLYDDPFQGIYNSKLSNHQIIGRLKQKLIKSAPRGVNTLHPDAQNQAGKQRFYCINGAPIENVRPKYPTLEPPLKIVLAGKTKLEKGMDIVINGLRKTDSQVYLDAFGETNKNTRNYAKDAGVRNYINFHGNTHHSDVINSIINAHVGICILPDRPDWRFHYPIKVGEYLAAGTIPLVTNLPGLRKMCQSSAEYVDPLGKEVSERLDRLAKYSTKNFKERAYEARARGEKLSWKSVRKKFAQKLID